MLRVGYDNLTTLSNVKLSSRERPTHPLFTERSVIGSFSVSGSPFTLALRISMES